jgi:hypothetical protein
MWPNYSKFSAIYQGSSCSWLYGSWIYNYLVSMQSVPIITNMSSHPAHGEVYSVQHYLIKIFNDFWQVSGFLWVLLFPPPINSPPQYIWNIVESGVKRHNLNPINYCIIWIGPWPIWTSYISWLPDLLGDRKYLKWMDRWPPVLE